MTTRDGLTGLAVIYDGDTHASLGIVESKLSDTHYLIKLYSFKDLIALDESCVVSVDDMTTHGLEDIRWHFFESIEAASNWKPQPEKGK